MEHSSVSSVTSPREFALTPLLFSHYKKRSWELMEGTLSDNRSCSKEVCEHLQEKNMVS